jgi:hypothetical protein
MKDYCQLSDKVVLFYLITHKAQPRTDSWIPDNNLGDDS